MNENILINCGLTIEQAKIYTYLLSHGLSPAKQLALKTNIGRALTYKVLDQLIDLNLIEKREDIGKIALFLPKHPRAIKEIVENRRKSLEHAFSDFNNVYGLLTSEFNSLTGRPNIQFFEGIEGIKYIHSEILEISQNIYVISSPLGKDDTDFKIIIKEQIEAQAKLNISTKALTPLTELPDHERIMDDKKNLVQRKIIDAEKLNIPAQIIIYGDKVAITNFKETMITILIESKYIAETFKIMFDYIWNHDHN